MAFGLFSVVAVLVTCLVFGAQCSRTKLKESKNKRRPEIEIIRPGKNELLLDSIKHKESETERKKEMQTITEGENELVPGSTNLKESERERIKALFVRETGDKGTFGELREIGWIGFTHFYLETKFDIKNLKSAASMEIVLDMVKVDLAEGAKPEEIVFGCCSWCPKMNVVSAVIEETSAKIKDVLEFEGQNGFDCLKIMFSVLTLHFNALDVNPAGTEMATEIEKSIQYLIDLGEKQGLKMNKILEKTDKSGETLLLKATLFSPKLASKLLDKGIKAKSIDHKFMTPQFKFESLHRPMIAAGVNPFALDCISYTQADLYSVSKELISELNPDLTSDLFYSTTSLPCNDQTCYATCKQGLPDPWYYNNGQIYNFEKDDCIGGGGEGTVFCGIFHEQEAAFKFVEIRNLKFLERGSDVIADLNKRLSEMKKLSETKGPNILPFYGHIRQQFSAKKVKELDLGAEIACYEVYITKQCEFNLAHLRNNIGIDINEAKNIIDQLIAAQEQLQSAGVSHNDIKPGNILVDYDSQSIYGKYKIYIGDFGQADQLGGTPGWTPPEFIDPRVPGMSDMYSFGLVFLYVLCENDEVFYSIRDNFIADKDVNKQWFLDLMDLPMIKLVQLMTEPDHKDRIGLSGLKLVWKTIRKSVKMITSAQLGSQKQNDYVNKNTFLTGHDSVNKLQNIIGRNLTVTETKNTFTRTHLQGDSTLCWLYSITSSLHQSMKLKAGKFEILLDFIFGIKT